MSSSAICVRHLVEELQALAPLVLAEEWDNVGLLLGDDSRSVQAVITCLTLTSDVAAEALRRGAQLIVTHHPMLFRPVQQLTTATADGRLILSLAAAGICVYSPHTAYDGAAEGINAQLAAALGLEEVRPLRPCPALADPAVGGGRYGRLSGPLTGEDFLRLVARVLRVRHLEHTAPAREPVQTVAIACGSGGEFLAEAAARTCDVLVTGEARFHTAIEARERGVGLVLAGHYATERPGVESLARRLASRFPDLKVWASEVEIDPLRRTTV